jgi:hypothetical protein
MVEHVAHNDAAVGSTPAEPRSSPCEALPTGVSFSRGRVGTLEGGQSKLRYALNPDLTPSYRNPWIRAGGAPLAG